MWLSYSYEERLHAWKKIRNDIEKSLNPIRDAFSVFAKLPLLTLQVDPWDQTTWPDPWMLIDTNQYCSFTQILLVAYTVQLTNLYNNQPFEIIIYQNHSCNSIIEYALKIDKKIYYKPETNDTRITILNSIPLPTIH